MINSWPEAMLSLIVAICGMKAIFWLLAIERNKVDRYLAGLATKVGGKKNGWIVEGTRRELLYQVRIVGPLGGKDVHLPPYLDIYVRPEKVSFGSTFEMDALLSRIADALSVSLTLYSVKPSAGGINARLEKFDLEVRTEQVVEDLDQIISMIETSLSKLAERKHS